MLGGRWAVWFVVAAVAGSGRVAWPQAGIKPPAGIGAPTPDAPAAPTGPEGPKPLAIPQIASEAEGAVSRLRAFEVGADSLESVGAIERRLPQLEKRVSEATEQTYRILSDGKGGHLHLVDAVKGWLIPGRNPFGLYLYTPDVDELALRLADRILEAKKQPEDKPWGMYEFSVSDPDETLVRVGWPTRLRK